MPARRKRWTGQEVQVLTDAAMNVPTKNAKSPCLWIKKEYFPELTCDQIRLKLKNLRIQIEIDNGQASGPPPKRQKMAAGGSAGRRRGGGNNEPDTNAIELDAEEEIGEELEEQLTHGPTPYTVVTKTHFGIFVNKTQRCKFQVVAHPSHRKIQITIKPKPPKYLEDFKGLHHDGAIQAVLPFFCA